MEVVSMLELCLVQSAFLLAALNAVLHTQSYEDREVKFGPTLW